MFRADIIDYGNAFNLTMYLPNEADYIVWSRVSSSIAYVRDMLSANADLYPKFQVRGLLTLQTKKQEKLLNNPSEFHYIVSQGI